MSIHPDIIKAVHVASRFGFVSRAIYWDQISNSKQAMKYRVWKQIVESNLFEPIESALGTEDYLKLSKVGKNQALAMSLFPVNPPFIQQLSHDEAILRFALANENAHLIERAFPEVYLKSLRFDSLNSIAAANRKIPDLYFQLKIPDKKIQVALEYERTRKTQNRYRAILLSYASFKEVDVVLFIVNDKAIEKTIQETASRMQYPNHRRPLAFALANDVFLNPTNFPLQLQNEVIEFNRFVQRLHDYKEVTA